ncbi:hypothetical protein ERO13_D13G224000v2 [Gossypium hirsutum]|nr:hypothetical protein ERO13_D13G224000v2 [Gossypium hirsutum]
MEGIEHRMIKVNGINIHVAEKGEGPVILFLHGFPELWYSWRHQILALSSMGYRAVAPDLRGYGDSDAPESVESYTCFHIIGDLVELIDVLDPDVGKVPDKVKALVNLSVPFIRFDREINPVDVWKAVYGDDYYISRFQEYGEIEGEFAEVGVERVVKEYLCDFPVLLPKGKLFKRPLDEQITLPSWLSEEEANYYVTVFQKTGFTCPINYYRNLGSFFFVLIKCWIRLDLSILIQAQSDQSKFKPDSIQIYLGSKIKTPAKFIVGDKDLAYGMPGMKEYIHNGRFKEDVPSLEQVVVMKEEISSHIYDFFCQFH